MQKRTGLFDKLLILHLFSTSVLFIIIIISYYHIEKDNFNKTLIKKSVLIHDLLEISCVDPIVGTIAYDRTDQTIEALYKKNREIVYIEIYDPKAHIIAFVGNPPKKPLGAEEINLLFKHSHQGQQTNKSQDHDELMTYLKAGDNYIGLIRAGFTKKYFQKQLRGNILYFLGFFITAIAITSLIFYGFTNRWIILPIINVSKIMKNFGQDELNILLKNIKKYNQSISKDEIGIMSIAFERMISSIIKRTEEKEKAEERYRLIAENVADVIWTMNMNFDFTYISPSVYQQRGYTVTESMEQSLDEMVPPGSLEKMINLHNQKLMLIKAGDPDGWESVIFEIEQYCKNGDRIWTSNNVKILSGPDMQPSGILGIARDITERKLAETALMKSERNYREIFNASSDAIFIRDAKTGKIIDVNEPMLKMYGYKKQEVLGSNVENFSSGIAPYNQDNADGKFRRMKKGDALIFEWQAKKKNGKIFWVEVNLRLSKIGDENRILTVVRDITQRKKTQEMMVQSEKMLSVGGLAAGMAHEINNPLAGMMQTASVMANRLGKDSNIPANLKAAKEANTSMEAIQNFMEARGIFQMVKTINKSGRRMAVIVNNMLSFARKSDARISSHSLSKLLDQTLELAATDFDLKKHYDFKIIEIKKEYEGKIPLVPCEKAKIQQVLLNILRNGAQAMQEAGTENPLFILKIRFDESRKMVCLEIEDNGPGMDEKTRKRVFEPFYTTKPAGVGTGLGLSVSYFIITENHSGEMSVESIPYSGAKFIIRLPLEGRT